MAPRTSTIPAALGFLVDGLTPVLAPVEVHYGDPGLKADQEFVMVGDTDDPMSEQGEQQWAALGARARTEQFAVDLFVVVSSSTATEWRSMVERAFELFGLAETWLRTNAVPTVDGTAIGNWTEVARASVATRWITRADQAGVERAIGRRVFVSSAVRFNARI